MEARRFSVTLCCSKACIDAFCLPQTPASQGGLRQALELQTICLQNDQVMAWACCQN